jgi:hypothetical protein
LHIFFKCFRIELVLLFSFFTMIQAVFSHPMGKRKTICVLLGIFCGFACAYCRSINPELGLFVWGSPQMWHIVFNRFLIGIVVFLAGAFTHNPLRWRLWSWFRGATIGALVSLDLALSGIVLNLPLSVFWGTIVSGSICGLLIDVLATKFSGEGRKIIEV